MNLNPSDDILGGIILKFTNICQVFLARQNFREYPLSISDAYAR
jgi:hypothetical protein